MLKNYYSILFWMSGDLNDGVLSPAYQRTANDIGLIKDFLDAGDPAVPDRAFYGVGDGLVEDTILTGGFHASLFLNYFGADYAGDSYANLAGNNEATPDLTTAAGVIGASAGSYGVRNVCLWTNDVIVQAGAATAIASEYEDVGGGPYISGVRHAHSAGEPWISLIDGFDIEHITGPKDASARLRLKYYFDVLNNVFATVCPTTGTPIGPLPVDDSRTFGNYVRLANTPLRNGEARIELSLSKADRVQVKVFDVSGRLVRTLADRMFEAGEHTLRWDGTDNDGRPVARGVYFSQSEFTKLGFKDNKKITVLH
jgi:hypothetical protein